MAQWMTNTDIPWALEFEMEKILESWCFQESCLKSPKPMIFCLGFCVIQNGVPLILGRQIRFCC